MSNKDQDQFTAATEKLVGGAVDAEKEAHDIALTIHNFSGTLAQTSYPIFATIIARVPSWVWVFMPASYLERLTEKLYTVSMVFARVHAVGFVRSMRQVRENGACDCPVCKLTRGELGGDDAR